MHLGPLHGENHLSLNAQEGGFLPYGAGTLPPRKGTDCPFVAPHEHAELLSKGR